MRWYLSNFILLTYIIFCQRTVYLCLGLQHCWCKTIVYYIKTTWLTHPSAPVYNTAAGSSVWSTSDAEVIFSVRLLRPGLHQHTGPHLSAWAVYWVWASHSLGSPVFFQQIGGKLSCLISRRLHWMAQWVGAQVAATTVWLTSNSQLEGTIGRVADTAHTGSFITRRSHLQPSVDSHRAINANDIHLLLWSNMENLEPTPRVVPRLGGYNGMSRQS